MNKKSEVQSPFTPNRLVSWPDNKELLSGADISYVKNSLKKGEINNIECDLYKLGTKLVRRVISFTLTLIPLVDYIWVANFKFALISLLENSLEWWVILLFVLVDSISVARLSFLGVCFDYPQCSSLFPLIWIWNLNFNTWVLGPFFSF